MDGVEFDDLCKYILAELRALEARILHAEKEVLRTRTVLVTLFIIVNTIVYPLLLLLLTELLGGY